MIYNQQHGITPRSIVKPVAEGAEGVGIHLEIKSMSRGDLVKLAIDIEMKMKFFAQDLNFEKAIELRDRLSKIRAALDNNKDDDRRKVIPRTREKRMNEGLGV